MKNSLINVELKIIRSILSILTFVIITQLFLFFFNEKTSNLLDKEYYFSYFIALFDYTFVAYIISFIWKKSTNKKERNNYILMILFLNLIGIWIWLPNITNEIKKTIQN